MIVPFLVSHLGDKGTMVCMQFTECNAVVFLGAEVIHAASEAGTPRVIQIALELMPDDDDLCAFARAGENFAQGKLIIVLRFVNDQDGGAFAIANVGAAKIRIRNGGDKGSSVLLRCHRTAVDRSIRIFVGCDERLIQRFKPDRRLFRNGAGKKTLCVANGMHDIHDVAIQTIPDHHDRGCHCNQGFACAGRRVNEHNFLFGIPNSITECFLFLIKLQAVENVSVKGGRGFCEIKGLLRLFCHLTVPFKEFYHHRQSR